jgi:hypothetical protein
MQIRYLRVKDGHRLSTYRHKDLQGFDVGSFRVVQFSDGVRSGILQRQKFLIYISFEGKRRILILRREPYAIRTRKKIKRILTATLLQEPKRGPKHM